MKKNRQEYFVGSVFLMRWVIGLMVLVGVWGNAMGDSSRTSYDLMLKEAREVIVERARIGDANAVADMLGLEVSPEFFNEEYLKSALVEAVRYGHEEVVDLILERKLLGKEVLSDALAVAIVVDHMPIQMRLLGEGANIDRAYGYTMLLEAGKGGRADLVGESLRRNGDKINLLKRAEAFFELLSYENISIEVLDVFLRNEYMDIRGPWGSAALSTVLMRSEAGKSVEVLKYLIAQGASVNSWKGIAPVYFAHRLEDIRVLIELGAQVSDLSKYGFDFIIQQGALDSAQYLIQLGADASKISFDNLVQGIFHETEESKEVVEYLISQGLDREMYNQARLCNAIARDSGRGNTVKKLVEAGVLPTRREVFEVACKYKRVECLKLFAAHNVSFPRLSLGQVIEVLGGLNYWYEEDERLFDILTTDIEVTKEDVASYNRLKPEYWSGDQGNLDKLRGQLMREIPIGSSGLNPGQREAIKEHLKRGSAEPAREIVEYLRKAISGAYFIGVERFDGDWDEDKVEALNVLIEERGDQGFVIPLYKEMLKDEEFISSFCGFVAECAGGFLYGVGSRVESPYHLGNVPPAQISEDFVTGLELIDKADKYSIPLFGDRGVFLSLIIKNGGGVKMFVPGNKYERNVGKCFLEGGSLSHYMSLTADEKEEFIINCKTGTILIENEFEYPIVPSPEMKARGLDYEGYMDRGDVAAVSQDGMIFGMMSVPFDSYMDKKVTGINRQQLIVDSFFELCVEYHHYLKDARARGVDEGEARRQFRENRKEFGKRLKDCVKQQEDEERFRSARPQCFVSE